MTCDFMKLASRKLWSYLSPPKQGISHLLVDNKTVMKNTDMASLFNQFFHSGFVRSDSDKPGSVIGGRGADDNSQEPPTLQFSQEGIFSQLLEIDSKMLGGPDDIPNVFLRRYAEWVSHYLLIIFEASLSQHRVPGGWHCARVISVFKFSEKHSVNDSRPISLTCTCCKIVEHALPKYLYS